MVTEKDVWLTNGVLRPGDKVATQTAELAEQGVILEEHWQ